MRFCQRWCRPICSAKPHGRSTAVGLLGAWSVAVLQSLLAVPVHPDDCGADAGRWRVVPGSHRAGRLGNAEAQAWRAEHGEAICTAARGDASFIFFSEPGACRTAWPGTAPWAARSRPTRRTDP